MNLPLQLFIIIIVLDLIFQKSKTLTFLTFFYVWTLAWTSDLPDYVNYEEMYYLEVNKDLGYYFISLLFKSFNTSYADFRLFILAAGWGIYCWFIIKYSKRCALTAVIYMCTVSFFDCVQYRNFLGFALCLIGLSYILRNAGGANYVKSLIFILLGASFHITNCFFLIFIFLNEDFISKFSKFQILSMGVVVGGVLMFFFSREMDDKFAAYDVGVSNTTRILLILLFIVNVVFIKYVSKRKINSPKLLSKSQNSFVSTTSIYNFNLGLFMILPAAFMSLNAMRIYRYMELVNISFVGDKLISKKLPMKVKSTALIVAYAGSYGIVSYLMHAASFEFVVYPMFFLNSFYGNL